MDKPLTPIQLKILAAVKKVEDSGYGEVRVTVQNGKVRTIVTQESEIVAHN